jgi:hypothetical protein
VGNGNDVPGELPEHPELLHQLRGLLHHVLGIQAGSQQLYPDHQEQIRKCNKCSFHHFFLLATLM